MSESKENSADEANINRKEVDMKLLDKPLNLSFGINRILGDKRTQRELLASPNTVHVSSDVEVSDSEGHSEHNNETVERPSRSPAERSEASSPASPTLHTQKFDPVTMLPSMYPFELTNSMLPFTGYGMYRGPNGVIKVPAHRAQPVMQLFTPYAIPWVDFRRDRFGGVYKPFCLMEFPLSIEQIHLEFNGCFIKILKIHFVSKQCRT